jgi:hypothetical protein
MIHMDSFFTAGGKIMPAVNGKWYLDAASNPSNHRICIWNMGIL